MLCSFSQMEISLHRNTPTKHFSIPCLFSIKSFTLLKHSSDLQSFHLYNDCKFTYGNLSKCFHVLVGSTLSLCINWVSVHKNKITFVLINRFPISNIWDSKTYSHLTFSYFQLSLILFFANLFLFHFANNDTEHNLNCYHLFRYFHRHWNTLFKYKQWKERVVTYIAYVTS